jgi:predicted nucleic acid-binding protein
MLDDSKRGIITKEFFDFVTQNNHKIFISEIVNNEIIDTTEKTKKETILHFWKKLNMNVIPYNKESNDLAWNYITEGVLTYNHIEDLLHVAYATVHNCDMIVSWNRKHIAKQSKIQKLNACNIKNNYNSIVIFTPEQFLTYFS